MSRVIRVVDATWKRLDRSCVVWILATSNETGGTCTRNSPFKSRTESPCRITHRQLSCRSSRSRVPASKACPGPKCIAEDGALYYVKGQQTTRASLWKEWISAHLAVALGLPLPPFALVQVDETLLAELPKEWRNIGATQAFGSRHHDSAAWFEASLTDKVPAVVQQSVLVFDWWVRNSDRLVGNTNLLWDADSQKLVVIDQDQAFDPGFDAQEFCQQHVFAGQWATLHEDLVLQAEWCSRLSAALPRAHRACDNAPPEWRWANAEMDVPADFAPDKALALLARCATPDLWRMV